MSNTNAQIRDNQPRSCDESESKPPRDDQLSLPKAPLMRPKKVEISKQSLSLLDVSKMAMRRGNTVINARACHLSTDKKVHSALNLINRVRNQQIVQRPPIIQQYQSSQILPQVALLGERSVNKSMIEVQNRGLPFINS